MTEMSEIQFQVVADLLRSREPVRSAVRLVLVMGHPTKYAADFTGLTAQSVSNALRRYRYAHHRLTDAYSSTLTSNV